MVYCTVLGADRDFMSTKHATPHPFPSGSLSEDRLAPLIRDVRRSLIRSLQAGLAKHGVAAGHWTFLRILWMRDDINQRRLSELAGVMEPTTVSALQAMERLGYVTRGQRPGNRKNIYVYLTELGRSLESKLMPVAEAIHTQCVEGVSEEDIAATRRTLMAIIDNLAKEDTAPNPRRAQDSVSEAPPAGRERTTG